jgi:hypothetical protein
MTRLIDLYGKALGCFVLAVVTVLHTVLSDGHVTQVEGVQIAIAVTTAALVWLVPVVPEWPWSKTVLGAALATLNAVATVIVNGWHSGSATETLLAGLTILLVRYLPAMSTVTPDGVEAD